jgi:hypothetical protein
MKMAVRAAVDSHASILLFGYFDHRQTVLPVGAIGLSNFNRCAIGASKIFCD